MSKIQTSMAAAIGLCALSLGGAGLAAAAEPSSITLIQTHPVLAIGEEVFLYAVPKHLGYFHDEGLDVSIQGVNGGTPAAQAVQSGAVQFATTMPESVLQIREQGGDVVAFYNIKRDNGTEIAIQPDSPIHDLPDLKGKVLGGMSWGSGGPKLVMHTLADMGIGPNDYQRVSIGAGAAAAAALTGKQVDALILWDAMFAIIENTGVTLRYIDMPIQRKMAGFTLATTDSYIKTHAKEVEGYCRAINKALFFTRSNVAAAVQIALQEFPTLRSASIDPDQLMKNDLHIMNAWLAKAETGVPIDAKAGELLPEQWEFTDKFYQTEGLLKGSKPSSEAFTNRFFERCNDFDRDAVAAAAKQYTPS